MPDLKGMSRTSIMNLLEEISPMAKDYVNSVFDDAVVLHAYRGEDGDGVFLKVQSEGLCVYYANFPDDSLPEILNIVREELQNSISSGGEFCFNVQGSDEEIIKLVQSNGFALDMEGYVLRHTSPEVGDTDLGDLTTQIPTSAEWADFVDLFEASYEQLNRDNGWDTKGYSKAAEPFVRWIRDLHEKGVMKSFWMEDTLIGCYIVEDNYIRDIVVHPRYQNKGYGSIMLKHCIHFMRHEQGTSQIHLRVTKSNSGAKRLYERHGFDVVSFFAEHSYQGA
jgi:ribosomal protein S18 acetylase RimI-like enzyme